jgi:hypothetical protein
MLAEGDAMSRYTPSPRTGHTRTHPKNLVVYTKVWIQPGAAATPSARPYSRLGATGPASSGNSFNVSSRDFEEVFLFASVTLSVNLPLITQ